MTPPPTEAPPALLTLDYSKDEPRSQDPFARVENGELRLRAPGQQTFRGLAVSRDTFRDVILDTELGLASGAPDDLFGVFMRQGGEQRFIFWALSGSRRCVVALADGAFTPLVDASLAPDLKLESAPGSRNRLQVVAIGPSLTFVLNHMVVTGVMVDQRFQDGFLGFYVQRAGGPEETELAIDWVQVRAVLPE